MHEGDREGRFADAAQAQHAHHLAAFLEHPLLEPHTLSLSAIQRWHREGIAPIEARRGEWMRMFGPGCCARSCSPFKYQEGRASRSSRGGGELRLHPEGIEVLLLLPGSQPEVLRFLVLLTGGKSLALDTKGKQALEMLDGWRTLATFPLPNGLLADAKEPGQCSLGQAHALAQLRARAPKGVLPLVQIGMWLVHLAPPGMLCAPFTMARTCSRSRTSSCSNACARRSRASRCSVKTLRAC